MSEPTCSFSTSLAVAVLTRPEDSDAEWQPFDTGPGYFHIPAGHHARLKIRGIGNPELAQLAADIADCPAVVELDLSENRNVTDSGLAKLGALRNLTGLNLSACSLSDGGMKHLVELSGLRRINLSYCNRLTDQALRQLSRLRRLEYLDLQGCAKITHAGVVHLQRPGLAIHFPTRASRNQPRPNW